MPDITELVDAQLRTSRGLLGAGNPPQDPAPRQLLPQPAAPASWSGPAQQRVAEQADAMAGTRNRVDGEKTQVHNEIAKMQSVGPRALQQLNAVEATWAHDREALSAQRGTPEGVAGVAQAGQQRVAEARQVVSGALVDYTQSAEAVRAAQHRLPTAGAVPLAHVDPRTPPTHPRPPICYIGTADGDVATLCPPETDTVSYIDDQGRYVFKDLQTGVVTTHMRPGPLDSDPQTCWLPSAGASRSICGPDTTTWIYPRDGFLVSEVLDPDGQRRIAFETPPGPLIP